MSERQRIQQKRKQAIPLPSIQSDLLQRSATTSEQDAHEVPSLVHEVLSSSGQPLDTETRSFMEPRFGHDFSQVRIHTDERAAQSAQEVSAQAYTLGNDIAFNTGRYNPQTHEGKHLLAHELAHVTQQSPAATQQVANENLQVSHPASFHEREAEQTAQTVINQTQPQPTLLSQVPMAEPNMLHRVYQEKRMPQWGSSPSFSSDSKMWFNPHATLYIDGQPTPVQDSWFTDAPTQTTFNASPGSSGFIHMEIDAGWFEDNFWPSPNEYGSGKYTLDIHFTVTPEGVVQWGAQAPITISQGDGAALISPVPVTATPTPTGGMVVITPTINGTSSSSTSVGGGGNVTGGKDGDVKVGAGVGGNVGYSVTTPSIYAWQNSYTIALNVPKPTAVSTVIPADAHFKPGSHQLEEGQEREILNWYRALPIETQRSVESGATEIRLEGHASTTQPGPANRKLAEERVQAVQAVLQDFAGSQARFHTFAYGEYEASTPDSIEDWSERYVQIAVTTTQLQASGTH